MKLNKIVLIMKFYMVNCYKNVELKRNYNIINISLTILKRTNIYVINYKLYFFSTLTTIWSNFNFDAANTSLWFRRPVP